MLKYLIIALSLIGSFKVAAQTLISGKLQSTNGDALSYATVTIENPADSSIIAYAISNDQGFYKTSFNSSLTRLLVRMKYVNHQTQFSNIKNETQVLNFRSDSKIIELKEIKIKSPPIIKKNDTLTYNLNSFASLQDRTLADVLKKVPGLDVGANGQIKYQGRPINKFYVEGKDLMGGSYGIITNSLPNLDVSSIEILQNHQPVRMLKDKIFSPDAALNVKLKKKVTITGRGEFGLGLSPLLWQAKLTPMAFNKTYQALFSYKTNNIGEDITTELNNLGLMTGVEGVTEDNPTGNWLNLAQADLPSIDQKRYLFNRTHTASANILAGLTKKLELRGNISYLNDQIERFGTQSTTIKQYDLNGLPLNNIAYTRESQTNLDNQRIKGQFTLTQNTETFFLKNNLILQADKNKNNGYMQINNLPLNQKLYSPSQSIQNSFSTLIPFGKEKKHTLNFQSFVNYINDKQGYNLYPVTTLKFDDADITASNQLNQDLHVRKFNTENTISASFSKNKITITPKIGFKLNDDYLYSLLTGTDDQNKEKFFGLNWQNNLNYYSSVSSAQLELNYLGDQLKVRSVFPFNVNTIKARAPDHNFNRKLNKNTFEPFIFAEYKLNMNWKLSTNASLQYKFASIENLYPAYIFDALNFNSYLADISQINSKSINSKISYESPLSNTFIHFEYGYSNDQSNITYSKKILDNGQQVIEALNLNNPFSNNRYNLSLGKFFPQISTNITLQGALNQSRTNILLNGALVSIQNQSQNAGLKINYNQLSWLGLDYRLGFTNSNRKEFTGKINTKSILQNFQIFVTPVKNHTISFLGDYTQYKLAGNTFSNPFFDCNYRYTWDKRKIDFELKWSNIFNTKTFEQVYIDNIQTNQTTFNIRPSQLLLSVKFNFR